jgi:AcrR family transcriptional regulator
MQQGKARRPARAQQRKNAARDGRATAGATKKPATRPLQQAAAAGSPAAGRKVDAAERRQAILDAALTVFADHGYEAARLDDIASRAGVAKGTLYLYFKDKEALFEALVRGAVSPILGQASAAAAMPGMKAAEVLKLFFALFQKEVLGTHRKLILRLIISEGPRFPALAEFYYREVVSQGLGLMRTVARNAVESGEFTSDAAARFPQLIVAPLLMAAIWDGMFSRIDPLDVTGLLEAHRELLMGPVSGQPSSQVSRSRS